METTQDRMLTLNDVVMRVGLSRASIHRLATSGQFPKPQLVGPKATRWPESELEEWLKNRPRSFGPKVGFWTTRQMASFYGVFRECVRAVSRILSTRMQPPTRRLRPLWARPHFDPGSSAVGTSVRRAARAAQARQRKGHFCPQQTWKIIRTTRTGYFGTLLEQYGFALSKPAK